MGKALRSSLDPRVFLAKVGVGKSILEFHKNQNIFSQGDVADTVFYLQKGRVKLTVLSSRERKRRLRSWNPVSSLERVALTAIRCESRPRRRWKNV